MNNINSQYSKNPCLVMTYDAKMGSFVSMVGVMGIAILAGRLVQSVMLEGMETSSVFICVAVFFAGNVQ